MDDDKTKYDLKIREIKVSEKIRKKMEESTSTKVPEDDPFMNHYDRGIIPPPYELYTLSTWPEYSTILGPCVDSMTINISGLGYRIVPRDEKDTDELENEIKSDISSLRNFYQKCYLDGTYSQLRQLLRRDLELTGNSYTEIQPSLIDDMKPVGMKHLPSWNMRVCVSDTFMTSYNVPRIIKNEKNDKWEVEYIPNRKYFRKFAHITKYSEKLTYFKEWGDPRVISYSTGETLANTWKEATPEQRSMAANPVIHQKLYSPRSVYGLPRFIGNVLTMSGCRAAEEVNYITLKCNNMPAMMLLATNTAITQGSIDRIREFIEHRIQGDQNYSTILVVEAEPISEGMKDPGSMKMEIKPLTADQHTDAMFSKYMEGCEERVRQAYRLPPILIGRCVPIETEFLTENGWKYFDDISDDEAIATIDMESDDIDYQVPLKRYKYDYNGPMYNFLNKEEGLDFDCTPNHRMIYKDPENFDFHGFDFSDYECDYAENLPEKDLMFPSIDYTYDKHDECMVPYVDCYKISLSDKSVYDYNGKICCFTTPNGTIITRKNGSEAFISHNSDDYTRSCYSEDTETLTENGLKLHYNIEEDEKIIAFNYDDMTPYLVTPSSKHVYFVEDEDMYHVHTEYTDFKVTGEHKIMLIKSDVHEEVLAKDLEQILINANADNRDVCIWGMDEFDRPILHKLSLENISVDKYTGTVYCYSVPDFGYFVTCRNGKMSLQGNTADSSKKVAEEQVFSPERRDEDDIQNIKIVPYLGIRHAVIKSNTPDVTDNYELTQLLAVAERSGGLSPYISRFIVEDVLGKDLPDIDETIPNNIPFTMTMLREQLNAQAEMTNTQKLLSDKEVIKQLDSIRLLMEKNNVGNEESIKKMERVIKLMELTQIDDLLTTTRVKKEEVSKTIREEDGQYCVYSEDGSRSFGCYDTKDEAEERLREIEYYSEKNLSIVTKNAEERIIVGAVLVPGKTDLQGEVYDEDVVRKAAHWWFEKYLEDPQENGLKLMHGGKVLTTLKPYESYVLEEDKIFNVDISGVAKKDHPIMDIKSITYPKGTWIMMSKIYDDDIWNGIKNGDYLGYSIGGMATVEEIKRIIQNQIGE